MKVAIVGSREYPKLQLVRDYISTLSPSDVVVSGGAKGVDRVAANTARSLGLRVETHFPDWLQYSTQAGVIRNARIVANSERMVAFWDEASRGTLDAINRAKGKGIPVVIFDSEGREHA